MSAGEWSGLIGSTLGYWGTVLLGVITFWQNEQVMQINKRLLAIEETDKLEQSSPEIIFTAAELFINDTYRAELIPIEEIYGDFNYSARISHIPFDDDIEVVIEFENTSPAKILNLNYNGFGFIVPKKKLFRKSGLLSSNEKKRLFGNKVVSIKQIDPESKAYISFRPLIKDSSFIYTTPIEYENKYGQEFRNNITVTGILERRNGVFNVDIHIRHYKK
jgi:hypothetical protein